MSVKNMTSVVRIKITSTKKRFSYLFCLSIVIGNCFFIACTRQTSNMPREVATGEKAAISPSGEYILVIVSGHDRTARFQSFQILDRDGKALYLSSERFGMRHTTYFLWDQDDRVWVYSGDIGTFFWEYEVNSGEWQKRLYAQSDVPAPEFLKKVRPDFFSR